MVDPTLQNLMTYVVDYAPVITITCFLASGIDALLGLIKSYKFKTVNSKSFGKIFPKFLIIIGLAITVPIAAFLVDTTAIVPVVCLTWCGNEALSIISNLKIIYPESSKFIDKISNNSVIQSEINAKLTTMTENKRKTHRDE